MRKPFFYNQKLCKGCNVKGYIVDAGGRKDKWFCFGITTAEARKLYNIPEFDKLRLCIKHPPLKKLPEKNLFQLNLKKDEVLEIIKRLSLLLNADKVVLLKKDRSNPENEFQ